MSPKVKVGVNVFLTEDDQIGVQTSSKTKITTMGLLVMGMFALMMENPKEESLIQRVTM